MHDFRVEYFKKEDDAHTVVTIKRNYTVKYNWSSTYFLGYTLYWDDKNGIVKLGLPCNVKGALQ